MLVSREVALFAMQLLSTVNDAWQRLATRKTSTFLVGNVLGGCDFEFWSLHILTRFVFLIHSCPFNIRQSTEDRWEAFTVKTLNDCEEVRQKSVNIEIIIIVFCFHLKSMSIS